MATLPPFVYYLFFCLRDFGGTLPLPTLEMLSRFPALTTRSVTLYVAWLLFQALLQIGAPGKSHMGVPLSDGTRLRHRMNGWFSFWFTVGLALLLVQLGWIPATILYDEFGSLLTVVQIFAFAFSGFLFFYGKTSKTPEKRTGNALYDYFIGTALNPRLGRFDFKLFCESRPGLILWVLVNLSFAAKQYELHGTVTLPMILVNAFQFLYVSDHFFHEEAILTTWDIKHENFGWMLCWGDLVWVPFTYSLQAHYLINNMHELSVTAAAGIVILNTLGFVIFRGANIQKHRFRKDPTGRVWGKAPECIRTANGSLLLTSGWWGVARHSNYFGDLLMALAWCLPTGFRHPLTYFYVIYFTILIVHREWRDNAMCLEKYGKDWTAYCQKVRWRIVPGVY
jgi:protein-S-isoprenylcysteine O-methyltransferase Ste14